MPNDHRPDECAKFSAAPSILHHNDPKNHGWLASYLLQQSHHGRRGIFASHFGLFYERLRALGRRQRRVLLRRSATALTGAALLFALSRAPVQAANITVVNGEVAIDADGNCSLREAIINANNDAATYADCIAGSGADIITLPTNGSFSVADYQGDYSGYTGLPEITTEITIEGNGSTIQRAAAATDDFRLLVVSSTGDLTLNDLTIQDFSVDDRGGAIFVNQGTLVINDSTLQDNYAGSRGGAVAQEYGDVTIDNTVIDSNESDYDGGGVFNRNGTLTIIDSVISNNDAYSDGGGVGIRYGQADIRRTTISGNEANDSGGGISATASSLYIYQSAITGNVTEGAGGGLNTDFACECGSSETIEIVNSTISGNQANYGGGIFMFGSSVYGGYADMTLTNVTISDNTATDSGGGFNGYDGSLTLNRTLIAGNDSPGSGIDEIVAPDNTTVNNFNLFGHSGLTTAQAISNFTPGATDITATSNGTQPTALASILNTTLALNAATTGTETHALVANSPALDRAPSTNCVAPSPTNGVDQRDVARNQNGNGAVTTNECDIGAYEYIPVDPGDCTNQITNIIGIGMGDTKKSKLAAKLTIPNQADLVGLYGQLAGKDYGRLPKYVRFMYTTQNYVELDDVTGTSARLYGIFSYGTELNPAPSIKGRWFLQKGVPSTPRAFILYPTYETEAFYRNAFVTFPDGTTNIIGPGEPWSTSQTFTIEMEPTDTTVDVTIQVALVDNDNDTRPVTVTAQGGAVSASTTVSGPSNGSLLNIITLTLEDVPAGVSSFDIEISTPPGGESAAVVGATVHFLCGTN